MTGGGRRRRGDPLIALAVIVSTWVGARALAWDHLAGGLSLTRAADLAASSTQGPLAFSDMRFTPWPDGAAPPPPTAAADTAAAAAAAAAAAGYADAQRLAFVRMMQPAGPWPRSRDAASYLAWTLPPGPNDGSVALGERSVARSISPGGNTAPFPAPSPAETTRLKRWSADVWMLARSGTAPLLASGPAPASYGASQTGAIVRYAIAPQSRYRPAIYARVDSALSGAGDAEVALGLSARPLPAVPVIALAEARATRSLGKLRVRPAVMLVTQLPPFALPVGLRGEAYVQGGYVAGRGATPFVDGQFTFDRPLARVLGHKLRVGGGVWGGAQQGAARLDVGPSTRVDLKLNRRIFARLALDYRLHVFGNAEPGSGPALTLAAGF